MEELGGTELESPDLFGDELDGSPLESDQDPLGEPGDVFGYEQPPPCEASEVEEPPPAHELALPMSTAEQATSEVPVVASADTMRTAASSGVLETVRVDTMCAPPETTRHTLCKDCGVPVEPWKKGCANVGQARGDVPMSTVQ